MLRNNENKAVFGYKDFVGDQVLNFDLVNKDKTESLIKAIAAEATYEDVLHDIFNNDFDALARSATYAFYLQKITHEALGSMLQYRSMKRSFPEREVQVHALLNENKTAFTQEALKILPDFFDLKTRNEGQQAFFKMLKEKPHSEHCFFVFEIPSSYLAANEDVERFLAVIFRTMLVRVRIEKDQKITSILVFSMGAKDALNKAIFKENAKSSFPRLSNTISIDDIDYAMQNDARFVAVSHPDVPDQPFFHRIKVKQTIFITLHDDLHVRIICGLPNQIYEPWLKAIRVARAKTNILWSKDIWDTVDGAFSPYLVANNALKNNSAAELTKLFLLMLDAQVFSEGRPMGLFSQSPFFDTTWLLMIDIALNKKDWLELSIDPAYFSKEYAEMYTFIMENMDLIKNEKNPATQVARIKAKYFNLEMKKTEDYQFVKKDRYTQLVNQEGHALFLDKAIIFKFLSLLAPFDISLSKLNNFLLSGELKKEDLDDVQFNEKITRYDYGNLRELVAEGHFTYSQFKKLSFWQIEILNQNDGFDVATLIKYRTISSSEFMALSLERSALINKYVHIFLLILDRKINVLAFNELSDNAILLLNNRAIWDAVNNQKLSMGVLEDLAIAQLRLKKGAIEQAVDDEEKTKTSGQPSGRHLKKLSIFSSSTPANLNLANNNNNDNKNNNEVTSSPDTVSTSLQI